jgi:hypothetical protein
MRVSLAMACTGREKNLAFAESENALSIDSSGASGRLRLPPILAMKQKIIKSVLWNFLGTYMSRYSEFRGYWLFGFFVKSLEQLEFDLLAEEACRPGAPQAAARALAGKKFREQMEKAGLSIAQLRKARLTISRLPGAVDGKINNRLCTGYNVSFKAGAFMDNGKQYERERRVFVAPHNPWVEMRSGRYRRGAFGMLYDMFRFACGRLRDRARQ